MKREDAALDMVFSALANKHRREIIYLLSVQPFSIQQLAVQLKMSLPAIHRHIKVLEEARLIQRKKSGRVNFLAIRRERLILLQQWVAQYHPHWASDQASLDNYIQHIKRINTKKE